MIPTSKCDSVWQVALVWIVYLDSYSNVISFHLSSPQVRGASLKSNCEQCPGPEMPGLCPGSQAGDQLLQHNSGKGPPASCSWVRSDHPLSPEAFALRVRRIFWIAGASGKSMLDSAVLSMERLQKDLLLEAFLWHGFSHGKCLHVIHNMGFLFWFIWSAQAMAYSIGFGFF